MTTFLDKLNLRPQEQRWVVAVMVVVLLILNGVFIWPYFADWSKVKTKMNKTHADAMLYAQEIRMDDNPTNGYKAQLAALDQSTGTPQFEGDIQLLQTIMAQARGKINILESHAVPTRNTKTNEFFEEQAMQISVDSSEKDLVDFIYGIGGDSSMIRVRELNLHPADVNRYGLKSTITLSANYQKKPETKAASSAGKPSDKPVPTPGKPAVTPAVKTALPAAAKKPPGK